MKKTNKKYMDDLKRMTFNGILAIESLNALSKNGIDIRVLEKKEEREEQENDFSPILLNKARSMSRVYEMFFCMENAARSLIEERLSERMNENWWETCVSENIKKSVETLRKKEEKNKYHTQRNLHPIGYTMFGDLEKIIINNWENFSDIFPEQYWISSRFNDLELSRNIIMHTGTLPETEIGRIEGIVRDWINQTG